MGRKRGDPSLHGALSRRERETLEKILSYNATADGDPGNRGESGEGNPEAAAKKRKRRTSVRDAENLNKMAAEFIAHHYDAFREKFGFPPTIHSKDPSLVKRMLAKVDLETLKKLHAVFLNDRDAFVKRCGYSIACFYMKLDSYLLRSREITYGARMVEDGVQEVQEV